MKKILNIILYIIAIILALCAILSLFRNADIRYIKMLDFPRIQFFTASFISLIAFAIIIKKRKWYDYLLIVGLLSGLFVNGAFLINYTSLVSVEVPWAKDLKTSNAKLSILVYNVKMTNRKAKPFIELIDKKKPDLILAMEVDKWWSKELKVIEKEYPYSKHSINEVTYGMIVYSKFTLENVKIDYLNNDQVPSFEINISLKNGKTISLHTIHPVPPTHFKVIPDNEGQKATALQKLGNKVESRQFPTIVMGDFNDVVWSYVDKLTNTKDILYDVRVGRGFYNSYNAENIFMRWPLDHILVTEEFKLKKLERLPKIGSDHFPIYAELVL